MTPQSLDLKLTQDEIDDADFEDHSVAALNLRAIADAATAKAAWGIYDWLDDTGELRLLWGLEQFLEAQGIQKPEVE